jgi:hypothetical protein
MTFVDIVDGSAVFVDANTFVYALAPEPNQISFISPSFPTVSPP